MRDGVLIISSAQGVNEELREAFNELNITHPDTAGASTAEGISLEECKAWVDSGESASRLIKHRESIRLSFRAVGAAPSSAARS